ncbi:MAG: DUF6502 family protein [Rhodospirillaceae bacterium]|nr:DUF6502 family protein [Rhodospirillaceae bacterium]
MAAPPTPSPGSIGEPPPALVRAITRLMRPLVRLLIARGITLPYLTNLLKAVYVDVAETSFAVDAGAGSTGGLTASRLSVLTGLQRKDIKRIKSEPPPDQSPPAAVSLGARLIGIWTGDPRFRDDAGKPLALPRGADDPSAPSFDTLVRTVSTDVRPKSILDEWLRLGLVTVAADGLVRLNADAFVPRQGFDEKVYYLGRNVADHIATSVHNVLGEGGPLFERAVYYDKLTPASVAFLGERARALGMDALLALNKDALARADGDDGKPDATQRMALGLYYYEGDDDAPERQP